jgi:hypothetical protein
MLDIVKLLLDSDKLPWILSIMALFTCFLFYRAQKIADSFDIRDLIVDDTTGKLSLSKLGQFVALVLSSWGLIYLIMHGTLTEIYFQGYMLTWAGANVVSNGLTAWANKSIDRPRAE